MPPVTPSDLLLASISFSIGAHHLFSKSFSQADNWHNVGKGAHLMLKCAEKGRAMVNKLLGGKKEASQIGKHIRIYNKGDLERIGRPGLESREHWCNKGELFPGCKLEYEFEQQKKYRSEKDFVTAVEFCSDYPYGKAVALFDLQSGTSTVRNLQWLCLTYNLEHRRYAIMKDE